MLTIRIESVTQEAMCTMNPMYMVSIPKQKEMNKENSYTFNEMKKYAIFE